MLFSAKSLCIRCSTAILLVTGAAQAQEACQSYVVVEGDHLRGIARRAYGNPDLYRLIFDANRDIIGHKADLILTGATLTLPCGPTAGEASTETAAAATVSEPLSAEVVDPASIGLSTEVVDPAKEPVVFVPEIPVAEAGAIAAAPEEPAVEEATETAAAAVEEPVVEEPAPAEVATATEESTPEPAETAPAEPEPEPVTEPVAEPVTEPATETAEAVEEAPAEEPVEPEVATEPETETVEASPAAEEPAATEPVAEEPAAEEAVTEEPVAVAEAAPEVAAEDVAETAPAPEVTETAAVAPAAAAPSSDEGPIRMVTGNGYMPFADEMLPGGGMYTQIVEMAIFRADPDLPYSLTFINDWQAHIDALLPSQAYDLSFPWVRPNCEAPETLATGDQARCNDFVFSAPYYEVVDGFYAAADSDLLAATEYSDFLGMRICRPESFTTGVLEGQGLSPDTVMLSRPQEADDCFKALADGSVDLVSIDTAVGDSILEHMGLTEKFRQNPNLATVTSLHVIAHKSNPRAVAMLGVLDSGAMEMNQSGEWWDIVSEALAKQ